MKKILFVLLMVTCLFSVSARDTYSRDITVLTPAAQTLIKNNFKAKVSHIKIDKDFGKISEYDVVLTDGAEITFDKNGNWKEVEVKKNGSVPDAFVPAQIKSYIKQNQKNSAVIGIEKNRSGYEVELANGVEMKFNTEGKFLRYD